MAHRFIVFFIVIGILSSGCGKPQTCNIVCSAVPSIAAVNYTFAELDTVIFNIYTANDSFNDLVSSAIISDMYWDTLANDTFKYITYQLISGYDVEIIVPSNNNKTYRYTKITLGGDQSQNLPCSSGDYCYRYLVSYELNGALVTFPANTNGGSSNSNVWFYFSK